MTLLDPNAPQAPQGFLKVLDLSHYQNVPSFDLLLQENVAAVLCKAMQGLTDPDPTFDSKIRGAARVGMPSGGYHYLVPGLDPKVQAQRFVARLKPYGPCLAAVDLEEQVAGSQYQWPSEAGLNVTFLQDFLDEFMLYVQEGNPWLYTTHYFMTIRFPGSDFSFLDLWVADYEKGTGHPLLPPCFKSYVLWQQSETDVESLLKGQVFDFNVSPLSVQALRDKRITFKIDSDPVWGRISPSAGTPA